MQQFQPLSFDMKDFMEAQRKNVQALTEAQQIAMDSIQAVAQRQTEVFSQFLEDNSKMATEIMSNDSPEQKMAKNADLFKKIYDRTVSNIQEISDMVAKSSTESGKILNKRMSNSIAEVKTSLEKSAKKAA
jgi:phasin family protein